MLFVSLRAGISQTKGMSDTKQDTTVEEAPKKKLSDEDMARVAEYLNSPIHQFERKPFRPWILLLILTVIVVGMSVLSLLYAQMHGIPLE